MGQIPLSRYVFSQTDSVYTPISGGTVLGDEFNDEVCFNNSLVGQSGIVRNTGFPIGFNFNYRGLVFDKFAVGTDGYIVLGTGSFELWSVFGGLNNSISPFTADLIAKEGSVLEYISTGTAPNRKLIVQWKGYSFNYNGDINFQVILNESTNNIQFAYGTFNISDDDSSWANVGINWSGDYSDWNKRATNSNWSLTADVPTRTASLYNSCWVSPTVHPQSGLIFNFAPPADITVPTMVSCSPAIGSTNVPSNTDLVIVFSEPVQKDIEMQYRYITLYEDGYLSGKYKNIRLDSSIVTVSGNTVTINPSDFTAGAIVTITIDSRAFRDTSGNDIASGYSSGWDSELVWSFKVEGNDLSGPIADIYYTSYPKHGSAYVDINSDLLLAFNEEIKKGSGNIIIKENGTVVQTIDVGSDKVRLSGNKVFINTSDFAAGVTVSVKINAGVFKDMAGNDFAGITGTGVSVWDFKTREAELMPVTTKFSPASNAVGIKKNDSLQISFSEKIRKGSGNILIKENGIVVQTIDVASTSVKVVKKDWKSYVTIDHLTFTDEALVNIEIAAGAFKDMAGNNYEGIDNATTWNFKIGGISGIPTVDVNSTQQFNVYPNPAVNSLSISSNLPVINEVSIKLLDLQGRIVYSEKKSGCIEGLITTIDLSQQAKGVYLAQLIMDKNIEYKKIIKE